MNKEKTTSGSEIHKQKKDSIPTGDSQRATSGELHQMAGGEHQTLTTNQGVAISDNQNSLRSNPRGPTLLEDFILREKSPISITSVFPNVSFTHEGRARTDSSS